MNLLWTKNNKIGSKLIQWGTEGDCSHFAVEFDDCVVLQSNMLQGVNLVSSNEFYKHNEVMHSINFKLELECEESVWKPLVKRLAAKTEYDKKAMAYWALQVIKHRITGCEYPNNNKWDDAKKFMCIELALELPDFIFGDDKKPKSLAFVTPINLFHIIDSRTQNSPYRVKDAA